MEGHLKASIGNIRVMCCMEDCPNRLFSVWTSSILALEKEKDADIDAEGFENAAYYTYSKLVRLSKQLQDKSENSAQLADAFGQLNAAQLSFLPSNERVVLLAQCVSLPTLMEHFGMNDVPIQTDLESERVWPTQPILHMRA